MYRALNIAKYIIRYCNEKNRTISNLKLQKLLYFVQAEFVTVQNPLSSKDNIRIPI